MINWGLEEHSRWSIRIIRREGKAELEVQARIGRLGWSSDGGSPGEHVSVVGKGGDARSWCEHHGHQLRLQSWMVSIVNKDNKSCPALSMNARYLTFSLRPASQPSSGQNSACLSHALWVHRGLSSACLRWYNPSSEGCDDICSSLRPLAEQEAECVVAGWKEDKETPRGISRRVRISGVRGEYCLY